jgi:copper chaperone
MTTELIFTGVTCSHCQIAVQNALKNVLGVQDANVDLGQGIATVQGDVDSQALIKAVVDEGYNAQLRGQRESS